jgi:hypothetical protein
VFVLLTAAPLLFAPPPPAAGTAAADVVRFYTNNRGALLFSDWLAAVGIVPSFIFFASIVAIVREAEGERGWLWLLSVLGLAGAFPLVMTMTVVAAVLPYSAASAGPELARVLSDVLGLSLAVYFFPIVAFFVAVGRIATTRGGLPAWLGYLAYLVAIPSLVATLGLFVNADVLAPGGTFSLSAFSLQVLWWLAASLVLLLRAGKHGARD